MKSKILISTGGSGGHVIPAITIHDHLKENYDISISSDFRGLKYLDDKFYKILVIDTPKLNNLILFPLSILKVFFLVIYFTINTSVGNSDKMYSISCGKILSKKPSLLGAFIINKSALFTFA